LQRREMFRLERMLMIGSAGANVGKTNLVCALLARFAKDNKIIGIKVTTVKAKDGTCPRGGRGCGVCSSLEGQFSITEETDANSHKDTGRLLRAGAGRVLWLRAMKSHLDGALQALLDILEPGSICICESNSLRLVAEPGLFLMVAGPRETVWKGSARQVREYADRIITSADNHYDFDIGRVGLVGGRWAMRHEATAIILAGGESSRIGTDKAMLPIAGRPMVRHILDRLGPHFDQVIVSANDPEKFAFAAVDVVADRVAGQGPLMALASALQASAHEVNFVTACDIPEPNMGLVRRMLRRIDEYDVIIPQTGCSRYEPLFAVYRKSIVAMLDRALSAGKRRIIDALSGCRVMYLDASDVELGNINTLDDYRALLERTKNAEF